MEGQPILNVSDVWPMIRQDLPAHTHFPVDVKQIATHLSHEKFVDPITQIKGYAIPGFEGLLASNDAGTKWMIAYNDRLASQGRIRFTLAHEFGHYLMHRTFRERFNCGPEEKQTLEAAERKIEKEADQFASSLLMPLDDVRRQFEGQPFSIDLLMHCAARYGVSLTAAALKWRDIADGRVIVVAVKDGFLDWACSNSAAYHSGAYFATTRETIEVPAASTLNHSIWDSQGHTGVVKTAAWFPAETDDTVVQEFSVIEQGAGYCYTLGILILPEFHRAHPRAPISPRR